MSGAPRAGEAPGDDAARAWIAAGAALVRVATPTPAVCARLSVWGVATLEERLTLPPIGVIADLGALLLGADRGARLPLPAEHPRLALALRRYEDAVLARLAAEPRLVAASDAAARAPGEHHPRAVALLVSAVLRHAGYGAGVEVAPGLVRAALERAPRSTLAAGAVALVEDAPLCEALAAAYEQLARGALRARELVSAADVFVLENLAVLGGLGQRLAIAEIVEVREALLEGLPRRVTPRRRTAGAAATALEDESQYPAGGFASVATAGSLENLVTSELVYMDGAGPRTGPDLFDVRWVEGELLYYTRDEALFVRRRREVVLRLSPALARARVKPAGARHQHIVMYMGAVVALVLRLRQLLGDEALTFRVVAMRDRAGGPSPLGDEAALLGLALREWRDEGTLEVAESGETEDDARAAATARHALVQVVTLGEPASVMPPRVEAFTLTPDGDTSDAWRAAFEELVAALV